MTTANSAMNKAREVAQEDLLKARVLAEQAAKSGSYLYPIKGIFYFISHRTLWKPLLSRIIPTMSLSLVVIVAMFLFAYVPQFAVLVWVNGPLAAVSTALLTLSESSAIISLISRTFLVQEALIDTFDGVMVAKGQSGVLAEGREIKSGSFNDPMKKLGKLLKSPFEKYSPTALIRYVMYLPLNFIPVVGTVLFVLLQGRTRGQSVHHRYFQLKKWTKAEVQSWLTNNTAAYTGFGTVATLLELVPIASILFSFTNTVGAALWAADIEANGTNMTQLTSGDREATSSMKAE